MRGGYIKLHRKFTKWQWYDDPNTVRVFIHLLLTASWEHSEFGGCEIRPGQVVTGRRRLAKDLKMSERAIRTALEHLKSTNEITIKSTNRFSIITIVKWSEYQIGEPTSTSKTTNKSTNNRPTKGQKTTTLKNRKNIKEVGGQPSFDSVLSLFKERGYKSNPQRFFDYYQSTGWKRKNGKAITDWVKVAEEWEAREKEPPQGKSNVPFIQEPPKYKEFEPEPKKERTQMPDSIRNKFKVVKGGMK